MSDPKTPVLARLVLFIICLALAGSLYAGVVYFAVDLPMQNAMALKEPRNSDESCRNAYVADVFYCYKECDAKYPLASIGDWISLIAQAYCYNWCDQNVEYNCP